MTARFVGGVTRGALPFWFLGENREGKSLVVVPDEADVLDVAAEMTSLFKLPDPWRIPSPIEIAGYPADDDPARQVALHNWLLGKAGVLVSSLEGTGLPCDTLDALAGRSLNIKPGLILKRPQFEEALSRAGYTRNEWTDQVGEYAIRGDVTDIWPAGREEPVRILWNFDTVDSIRLIDLNTQRSDDYVRDILVCPVQAGTGATLMEALPAEAAVYFFGSPDEAAAIEHQVGARAFTIVSPTNNGSANEGYEPPPGFVGNLDRLRDHLVRWEEDDWMIALFCHNQGEKDRLEEILIDPGNAFRGTRPAWLPPILIGDVEHGFINPSRRQAILTNSEIFGRYRKRIRLPKFEGGGALSSLQDIKPHDYLVHERCGIGRYLGLKTLKVGTVTSEYLQLEYRSGDKLYVPIFELQQVQKYLGAEGKRPPLSSLDTAAWNRVKAKVKEDVAKLAQDLLKNAAKRTLRPGIAFPQRTHLEEEFAGSFMYRLTSDQEKTLAEVEADMVTSKPMDRLICGDVGFGKTEIAMRAALKAALAAKQVVLLCPTTILAEQHWRNFSERMADYPVTVKLLSRFQDKSDQRTVIESLAKGGVDIIVGTHRLLSKDVQFKDLGLVIIDEEHRFGVKQKNKLLALRETVDVLSLTATPIPRTLASAMGGIKDLSVIESPPEGRLPIHTHVGVFDEDLMAKAVQTELDRGGQVFYVHNRVKTLLSRKVWLESVLPGVQIAMAHGQMREHQLEEAMHNFLHRKVNVLLATTIIESGLDIPSVNTLIVEESEEMGLSQLYQLRGRVGRSPTRAYCYLFYTNLGMTTDAKKRLTALKEFTSLGSGLRLAMRDMEIRGAGNLLGPQQHGNMAAVGVETYSRFLNEEIQKLKGEHVDDRFDGPLLELNVSAYLPGDYMPSETERVLSYKRILAASAVELEKIKEELNDRCGPLPPPAELLMEMAGYRLVARSCGISEIHEEDDALLIYFRKEMSMPEKTVKKLLAQPPDVLTFVPGDFTGLRFYSRAGEDGLQTLRRFFSAGLIIEPAPAPALQSTH